MDVEKLKEERNKRIEEREKLIVGKNKVTPQEEARYNWLGKRIADLLREIRKYDPNYLRQKR